MSASCSTSRPSSSAASISDTLRTQHGSIAGPDTKKRNLTLWAAVVAERLGFDRDEALMLARAVAGASAAMKGRALGVFEPADSRDVETERRGAPPSDEVVHVRLLGRPVPAVRTPAGVRAMLRTSRPSRDRSSGISTESSVTVTTPRGPMEKLATAHEPRDLALHGFRVYEKFRPDVPAGAQRWGAAGELDLAKIDELTGRPEFG